MKLNKNKGKVHPSPSSSSSSSSSAPSSSSSAPSSSSSSVCSFSLSSLNLLLPAAILTLISTLSLQDKEVLAYMITRSLKSTSSSLISDENNNNTHRKKKPSSNYKKQTSSSSLSSNHKTPTFDCGCFDCYTSYWFRWDSSPNRELIHQAIEAFEEHLATREQSKKGGKSRRREKEKVGRLSCESPVGEERENAVFVAAVVEEEEEEDSPEIVEVGSPENGESFVGEESPVPEEVCGVHKEEEQKLQQQQQQQQQQHKGLARKVLPDVIGLFNSRLWNLWSPNV